MIGHVRWNYGFDGYLCLCALGGGGGALPVNVCDLFFAAVSCIGDQICRATFLSVFVFGTNFSSLPILSIHSNKVSSKLMAYSQTGEVLNLEREESSHCCSYAWFKSTQLSIQYRATYELKNINKNVYFSFVYDLK